MNADPVRAPTRLMLVDDHPLVREGLNARLALEPDFCVVAEADSGEEALTLVDTCQPSLVLTDLSMRGMSGIELTAKLKSRAPKIGVIVLSMHSCKEYVANALAAGARGYVLKDCSSHEIVAAIHAVAAGGVYLSASLCPAQAIEPENGPTDREREILILLAQGYSNKLIAKTLAISVRTVESHRFSIRRKLGIDSPAALVRYVLTRGWHF